MNILNMSPHELDEPIYRIFKKKHLVEAFKKKVNVLVHPSCWQDPYENPFSHINYKIIEGLSLSLNVKLGDFSYAQCWSKNSDSAAMWNIYSGNSNDIGIQVETTPRKLYEAAYEYRLNNANSEKCIFLGAVKYLKEAEIEKTLKANINWIFDNSGIGLSNSLLLKRDSFEYENEIRLMYHTYGLTKKDKFAFNIEPNNLFTKLRLPPDIKSEALIRLSNLFKKLGYNGKIEKSKLYEAPNISL